VASTVNSTMTVPVWPLRREYGGYVGAGMRPAARRAAVDMPEPPAPGVPDPWRAAVAVFPTGLPAARAADPLRTVGLGSDRAAASAGGSARAANSGTTGSGSISASAGISGGAGTGSGKLSGVVSDSGDSLAGDESPPSVKSSAINWVSSSTCNGAGVRSWPWMNTPAPPNPTTLSHPARVAI
jgi:hypothetical protein